MTPDFNLADVTTWPATLTVEEVAAIYRRTPAAIRKACSLRRMVPMPYLTHPWRWRKSDVLRHVEGNRTAPSLIRRAG